MKRLYLVDKDEKEHFIMQNANLQVLHKACFEDRQKRKFKEAPYIRQWVENDILWIDFGSWSEFYKIEGVTKEDLYK